MDIPGITDEGEFTEITDVRFSRVDLVSRGANGIPILIAKQDADSPGLLPSDFVHDLIAKSPEEAPVPATAEAGEAVLPNGIVIKGSPADMAAFFSAARNAEPERRPTPADVAKAKYSAEDKRKMLAAGQAIENDAGEPSYMIGDKDDLGKAVRAVGRGGSDHDRIRAYVIRRAKALGASSMIPDNWNSDGSLKGDVAKEADVADAVTKADPMDMAGDAVMLDEGMDGMDPTVPLAAPDEMAPGDPTDPGSPAWESIDAATAAKWAGILARAKNALCMLAEREMLEAASADPSDAENAFSLEDAACAIDYAIGNLAVFAAGEQAEAEIGAEMADMCKALSEFDTAHLDAAEGLTAVAKAGRVLSAANEQAIRAAAESLQKVLASLPEAPIAKEKEGTVPINTIDVRGREMAQGAAAEALAKPGPVVKAAPAEEQARDTGPVNAGGTTGMGQPRATGPDAALPGDGPQEARPGDAPGRTVVKAALRVAVYDQSGTLAGITDPAAIVQRVAKADGEEKKPMQAVFDQDGDLIGIVDPDAIMPVTGAGGKPAAGDGEMQPGPAAAAADDDMPQPPDEAGTPADAVGKAAEENVTAGPPADLESTITKAVAAALGALAPAQDVAKSADVAAALAEVELLKARLAVVEETPAAPKVFTNGQVPPAEQLRGQDQGRAAGQVDVAKALERKGQLYAAPDARSQNVIAKSMQGDAIEALAAIHASRPEPVRVR